MLMLEMPYNGVKAPFDRDYDLFFPLFSGIAEDDNLQSMLVGAVMRKIKSRTWKKQRYFKLEDDCMTIWYKSKKAGNAQSTCKTT